MTPTGITFAGAHARTTASAHARATEMIAARTLMHPFAANLAHALLLLRADDKAPAGGRDAEGTTLHAGDARIAFAGLVSGLPSRRPSRRIRASGTAPTQGRHGGEHNEADHD